MSESKKMPKRLLLDSILEIHADAAMDANAMDDAFQILLEDWIRLRKLIAGGVDGDLLIAGERIRFDPYQNDRDELKAEAFALREEEQENVSH